MVSFFSDTVEATARQTKFVCRTSGITGLNFLKAVVLGFLEKADSSLNEIAQSFLDVGVAVTPKGLMSASMLSVWLFYRPSLGRRLKYSKTSGRYLYRFCNNSVRSISWIAASRPYLKIWLMNIRVVVGKAHRRF